MLFQISSGNGVDEVCRAIYHFLNWLEVRYSFEVVKIEYVKCKDCYKLVLIKSLDKRLLELEGTHLWHCKSPFRPKHKRKNWYFSFKLLKEPKELRVDESQIIYQTMKSPKKGGQHVNTTSSGVRAIYKPLNIEAISFDERSQHLNKKRALKRLLEKLARINEQHIQQSKFNSYKSAKEILRGGEVLKFTGEEFRVVKNKSKNRVYSK